MFKLLTKIPRKINLAFSGGVDSLVAAHFLKRGKHDLTLLHFNHGCQYSDEIERQCRERAESLSLPIIVGRIDNPECPKGRSLEDFWRRSRYKWLRGFNQQFITAHHIGDAIEQWIFSSLHGNPSLIAVQDDLVLRPFITTSKAAIMAYADRHNLVPVEDAYNMDLSKRRNYIRHELMPHALAVNPGLEKVIRKKYMKQLSTKV